MIRWWGREISSTFSFRPGARGAAECELYEGRPRRAAVVFTWTLDIGRWTLDILRGAAIDSLPASGPVLGGLPHTTGYLQVQIVSH